MDKFQKLLGICKKYFPNSRGNPRGIEILGEKEEDVARLEVLCKYYLEVSLKEVIPDFTKDYQGEKLVKLNSLLKEISKKLVLEIRNDLENFLEIKMEDFYHELRFDGKVFPNNHILSLQENPSSVKIKKEQKIA